MASDDEAHSRQLRRAAELELSSAIESRKILLEEHSSAFRWLTASLLAVNAGGLVALLNTSSVAFQEKLGPSIFFFIGILSSLLTGWLSQAANRSLMAPLGALIGYWITVADTGELDEAVQIERTTAINDCIKKSWKTQASGWVSAIMFCVASIWIAVVIANAATK